MAVNQCTGNSRGLSDPHVPGAQWQNGAMGNARWTGVPLKSVLEQAGVKASAREFVFFGADYLFVSRSFLNATVHLALFAVIVRMFTLRRERDRIMLAILAFLMVLAARPYGLFGRPA